MKDGHHPEMMPPFLPLTALTEPDRVQRCGSWVPCGLLSPGSCPRGRWARTHWVWWVGVPPPGGPCKVR